MKAKQYKDIYNVDRWLSFKELNKTNYLNCSIQLASKYQIDTDGSYSTKISIKDLLKHSTTQLFDIIQAD